MGRTLNRPYGHVLQQLQVTELLSHISCLQMSVTNISIFFSLIKERLWTHPSKLAKDPNEVTSRIANFRCLLNQRGVAAAPLDVPGRGAPIEPGSCYVQ